MKFSVVLAACAVMASAATQSLADTMTLGDQDFFDGQTVNSQDFDTASAGEPTPFDEFRGGDLTSFPLGNFDASFVFSGTPTNLLTASLTFGLVDDDGPEGPGSQVNWFIVNNRDFAADLDLQMEANPVGDATANTYAIDLTPEIDFMNTGDVSVSLRLKGPTKGSGYPFDLYNGAGIDFATLTYTVVPEPSAIVGLASLCCIGLVGYGWRRLRKQA